MKSFIYYIEYVMIKMDLKIYSVNSLYLIFGNVTGYFERINGNNYLTLVPSYENKEKLKKYHELWIKIRNLISLTTKNLHDHDENIWKSNLIQMTISL